MRTAVLLFGEIRGFPELWRRIYEQVVVPNEADVFMHNYYYDPDFLDAYNDPEIKEALTYYYENKGLNLYPNEELYKIFVPVARIVEKRKDFVTDYQSTINELINKCGDKYHHWRGKKFVELDFNAIMSQHYSRKRVIDLKRIYEAENGFIYDNVIMTRLDVNLLGKVQFLNPLSELQAKILGQGVSIFEQIVAGPSSSIDKLTTYIDKAPEYYSKSCNTNIHFMQNERFVYMHLANSGVAIKNYNYPLDYSHSRNGLSRFNKSFVSKTDDSKSSQIVFNESCAYGPNQKSKRWTMF